VHRSSNLVGQGAGNTNPGGTQQSLPRIAMNIEDIPRRKPGRPKKNKYEDKHPTQRPHLAVDKTSTTFRMPDMIEDPVSHSRHMVGPNFGAQRLMAADFNSRSVPSPAHSTSLPLMEYPSFGPGDNLDNHEYYTPEENMQIAIGKYPPTEEEMNEIRREMGFDEYFDSMPSSIERTNTDYSHHQNPSNSNSTHAGYANIDPQLFYPDFPNQVFNNSSVTINPLLAASDYKTVDHQLFDPNVTNQVVKNGSITINPLLAASGYKNVDPQLFNPDVANQSFGNGCSITVNPFLAATGLPTPHPSMFPKLLGISQVHQSQVPLPTAGIPATESARRKSRATGLKDVKGGVSKPVATRKLSLRNMKIVQQALGASDDVTGLGESKEWIGGWVDDVSKNNV
jgi:hypothetical protein